MQVVLEYLCKHFTLQVPGTFNLVPGTTVVLIPGSFCLWVYDSFDLKINHYKYMVQLILPVVPGPVLVVYFKVYKIRGFGSG